jgi:hypothetical protein
MEAAPAAPAEEARTEAARGRGGKKHSTRAAPSPDSNNSFSIFEYANIFCLFSVYNVPLPISCKYFLV